MTPPHVAAVVVLVVDWCRVEEEYSLEVETLEVPGESWLVPELMLVLELSKKKEQKNEKKEYTHTHTHTHTHLPLLIEEVVELVLCGVKLGAVGLGGESVEGMVGVVVLGGFWLSSSSSLDKLLTNLFTLL